MSAQELKIEFVMSPQCIQEQHADCLGKVEGDRPCSCGCGHKWVSKKEKVKGVNDEAS